LKEKDAMARILGIAYGLVVYLFFLGTFLYAIGFVENALAPKSIDAPGAVAPSAPALLIDAALLALFAVQHSVMARPAFKRWWTRIVPSSVERTTFVLFASLALALLCWQWRPMAGNVWMVQQPVLAYLLEGISWLGWGTVLVSTFLISHFELFGLVQVFASLRGRPVPQPEFRTPGLYRYVRHPIYLGFLLAFWSTPTMTVGHLVFSVATTGYILLGIWFEERDLVAHFGKRYRQYREQVGMLLPLRKLPAPSRREEPPVLPE
jgi:protein-S-isoprenylcysteine O-methyltransferase Ste14